MKQTMQNMQNMMQDGVMNCAAGGWWMVGSHVVALVVLILAGAALVKYLFSGGRRQS